MAWPIITLWLAVYPQRWRALIAPSDNPRAESIGPDPDKVLLVGPGKSSGLGVHTHELGLGGHLARELSALTRRGCSVDIVSDPTMSNADVGVVINWARLNRYDALVLTLGGGEVLHFRSLFGWRRAVTTLLDTIRDSGGGALHTSILGIAPIDGFVSLPSPLVAVINRNIQNLNDISEQLCAARASVTFVAATVREGTTEVLLDSPTYAHWAREVAPAVAAQLTRVALPPASIPSTATPLAVLDNTTLTTTAVSNSLTTITQSARVLFDTTGAAVTFHDQEAHWFTSISGVGDMRREEAGAFCSRAFTTRGLVVLENTLKDERFADHPWVVRGPRIRFYAGFPITNPHGDIVGAICVFDTEPRRFDLSHETLLRELARRAESAIQRR
ncbi:GAF domain-containing protein [Salinibacterium sp. UTAS2018]|uniref:GAF domain-containing protein n=1 Tax=Salinibacterium sp. UTAS2018 TaxID=2508880 RepID=UPI001009815C|nr:GAF domain-containing protein [Salinibacterium sp. UTAS2018]QAV69405.1 GAF domain-containing protein [Salinibacterium sp. UTAS2018]